MKALLWAGVLCLALTACGTAARSPRRDAAPVAIAAHRGFWLSDQAGGAQNSIASLRAAQQERFWGSEFDIHITADDQLIVNHDNDIEGLPIWDTPYAELAQAVLPNGEHPATLEAYLEQGRTSPCMLVLEFKWQKSRERSQLMVQKTVALLRQKGLWSPERVMFISFDLEACRQIAALAPGFTVQYLSGDKSPAELIEAGVNGLDYHFAAFGRHPEWVEEAHALGMSVNVWTVNEREDILRMIDLGVDCITTNQPLLVRELLGSRELPIGAAAGPAR